MKNIEQIAKSFLEKHPDVTEVYVTDDGFVFTSENYARLHAREAKVEYKKFVRKAEEQEPESASKSPDKMTVKEIKALLDEKGIEYPAKAKKDELLALLNEANEAAKKQTAESLSGKESPEIRGDEVTADNLNVTGKTES